MKFSRPELMGSFGIYDQTYYEMGSTQSQPCSYKSPTVTKMEVVYQKQVPTYAPVGTNTCLGDRPYENYSMTKHFKRLSVAKKYCNIYRDCDIIVEIDRSEGMYIYDM